MVEKWRAGLEKVAAKKEKIEQAGSTGELGSEEELKQQIKDRHDQILNAKEKVNDMNKSIQVMVVTVGTRSVDRG